MESRAVGLCLLSYLMVMAVFGCGEANDERRQKQGLSAGSVRNAETVKAEPLPSRTVRSDTLEPMRHLLEPDQGSTMFRGNAGRTGSYPGSPPLREPAIKWKFKTDGAIWSSPAVWNGMVYFGSKDGFLYAVDSETGAERWKSRSKYEVTSSPAVSQGMVFLGGWEGAVVSFDASTGRVLWKTETKEGNAGSPAVTGGAVFAGWNVLEIRSGRLLRDFRSESPVMSESPAAYQGSLYSGAKDTMVSIDIETGATRWKFRTEGSIWSGPAISEDIVYFGNDFRNLYAVDAQTGKERWKFDTRSPVRQPPAVAHGMVFLASGYDLHAVTMKTGRPVWKMSAKSVFSPPAVAGGVVLVGCGNRILHALDVKSGRELWTFKLSGGIRTQPVVHEGTVYVGADDGYLYALHRPDISEEVVTLRGR